LFDDQPDLAGKPCLVWDRDEGEPAGVSEVVGGADFGERINSHVRLGVYWRVSAGIIPGASH
jgi:hypothetical protein